MDLVQLATALASLYPWHEEAQCLTNDVSKCARLLGVDVPDRVYVLLSDDSYDVETAWPALCAERGWEVLALGKHRPFPEDEDPDSRDLVRLVWFVRDPNPGSMLAATYVDFFRRLGQAARRKQRAARQS